MTISFTCPHCGLETLVEDDYAGQSGPCYGCNKTIQIPQASASPGQVSKQAVRKKGSGVGASIIISIAVVLSGLAAMVVLIAAVIYLVGPAISTARIKTQSAMCEDNLRQIGNALLLYEADYGSFPPAYIADEKGKPMHSWRVLLLPYLDEPALYQQYDMSQPWDGPENINLVPLMPDIYGCPGDPQARQLGETTYMVVVGSKTVFPGQQSVSLSQISDGLSETILVVETSANGVSWTEPSDLDLSSLTLGIGPGTGQNIGCYHGDGANVLMADGDVFYLQGDTPGETIESLLTPSGNEDVPLDVFGY